MRRYVVIFSLMLATLAFVANSVNAQQTVTSTGVGTVGVKLTKTCDPQYVVDDGVWVYVGCNVTENGTTRFVSESSCGFNQCGSGANCSC